MLNRRNWTANIDWFTIFLFVLLVFIGWVNIYASAYDEKYKEIYAVSQRYGKQLIWIIAAFVIAFIILMIDSKFYRFFAYPIYGSILFLLIIVLVVGREINGAHSWIEIGSFRLQPAEFAKFATALALSRLMSTFNFSLKKQKALLSAFLIIFLPAALIILQNDMGSALVYFALLIPLFRKGFSGWILLGGLFLVLLFIASFKINILSLELFIIFAAALALTFYFRRIKEVAAGFAVFIVILISFLFLNKHFNYKISLYYIVFIALVFSSIFYLYWIYKKKLILVFILLSVVYSSILFLFSINYIFNHVMEKHQQDRIQVLLGVKEDPRGVGYNVHQSKIAIGSGGFYGKGFLQGTQTKYKFVPEQSTDFIFCTVGEEWGFLGTTTTIFLFLLLIWKLLRMAERQKDNFSLVYGYSVASILFFHFAINIGMTIGLAPVIGIPLPFFSYGGSSLWGFTILLFVFIKLDASRNTML